ncbi:hypothetical protein B1218_35490 [Pseudomonas ogarae]|nr:hypothetical protein B1218_35490 [Pseudomonas ogarae]
MQVELNDGVSDRKEDRRDLVEVVRALWTARDGGSGWRRVEGDLWLVREVWRSKRVYKCRSVLLAPVGDC